MLNFSIEEIRLEDIEIFGVETHCTASRSSATGQLRVSMATYNLTVKLKDQRFGENLGRMCNSNEFQEKLNQFNGLPR